ncbi:MAG: glycine--tRNA ligase subunit beta [Elusimicrobia bacterium GWA2_69_24]|nr:MAG: glycine--tRNA ligase subunit beta [Elusimicrobia bacterium GWA2_69_24]HBL17513.1 glycine--tRNA ligase subunit beta [Elusimicrobiota bacterium]
MKDALLEIGTESLPARFLAPMLRQLETKAAEFLKEHRLPCAGIRSFGTPMRQALLLTGLPEASEPETREVTGPPARLLKDAAGNFTPQAAGFARSQGVSPEALTTVTLPKGEFLAAQKTLPGEPAAEILAKVFPALLSALEFPKSLVWEETRFRFARPIRTLVALYGARVVGFQVADVRSGGKTRGLAALGGKPVKLASPGKYVDTLRNESILVDVAERREALLETLGAAAKDTGGRIDLDPELLHTVLCLTEHPVAVVGHFDQRFLELPQALLMKVLKRQLMFFPVLNARGGLAADFVGVRDGISEGQKEVQVGFERVLTARLSDARFFFDRDRETPLAVKAEGLARVSFQKGLGTMGDKTVRGAELSRWIVGQLLQDRDLDADAVERISRLCCADLLTGVVGEFPELQGVMGGVYARHEGLPEKVALGLEEFYFPAAAKAPLPTSAEGCIASLSAKLDTVCAMLAGGFKPTGSEDPFALRRLGVGIVRILLEKQLPLSLPAAADQALALVASTGASISFDRPAAREEVLEFLWQRFETQALEQGYRIEELRAVKEGGLENLVRTYQRLAAVHLLRAEADFPALAQAFKRASNILRQAAAKGLSSLGDGVQPSLLAEASEKDLYDALCRAEGEVREKVAQGLYEPGLRILVGLKPQVDRFFDDVLVMADDESIRDNRLRLLSRMLSLFKSIADISQM